ncbi:probable extracellular repeat, HAF family [Bradyrhizobium sp. Gha]|nr:probable extracellular repeat, HAF family [Bradyrhizobium sp. Gha]
MASCPSPGSRHFSLSWTPFNDFMGAKVKAFDPDSGYSFVSFDPLLPPYSSVNRLNNSGQLVGTYTDSGGVVHGFIWKNGILTTVDGIATTQTA